MKCRTSSCLIFVITADKTLFDKFLGMHISHFRARDDDHPENQVVKSTNRTGQTI